MDSEMQKNRQQCLPRWAGGSSLCLTCYVFSFPSVGLTTHTCSSPPALLAAAPKFALDGFRKGARGPFVMELWLGEFKRSLFTHHSQSHLPTHTRKHGYKTFADSTPPAVGFPKCGPGTISLSITSDCFWKMESTGPGNTCDQDLCRLGPGRCLIVSK